MASTLAEMEQRIEQGLRDIAAKWIRGRIAVADLQGSGLVIAGKSSPQRALLALIDECSSDMGTLLDPFPNITAEDLAPIMGRLPDDYRTAVKEMYSAWRNRMLWKHRRT